MMDKNAVQPGERMAVDAAPRGDAVLRRLGGADMEEVSALESLCFDSSWSGEQYREACRGGWLIAFGAFAAGSLACFASFSAAGGEAEVLNIATHPAWRRRGLAERLLRFALAQLAAGQGPAAVFLDVDETNAPALALYRKTGFTVTGRRRKYYGGIHDAILMSRELPAAEGQGR